MLDLADVSFFSGIVLLGTSLWILFGLPGLLAYLGTLLIIVGVAYAVRGEVSRK
jgi:hypothetical protein